MTIKEILNKADAIGACDKTHGIHNYESLCNLYFSPQGREFCEKHTFPQLEDLRALKAKLEPYDVFVDSGDMISYSHRIAVVGATHATVIARGTNAIFRVIVQHGASVEIIATDYAVVDVININGGEIVIKSDETVKIL